MRQSQRIMSPNGGLLTGVRCGVRFLRASTSIVHGTAAIILSDRRGRSLLPKKCQPHVHHLPVVKLVHYLMAFSKIETVLLSGS